VIPLPRWVTDAALVGSAIQLPWGGHDRSYTNAPSRCRDGHRCAARDRTGSGPGAGQRRSAGRLARRGHLGARGHSDEPARADGLDVRRHGDAGRRGRGRHRRGQAPRARGHRPRCRHCARRHRNGAGQGTRQQHRQRPGPVLRKPVRRVALPRHVRPRDTPGRHHRRQRPGDPARAGAPSAASPPAPGSPPSRSRRATVRWTCRR